MSSYGSDDDKRDAQQSPVSCADTQDERDNYNELDGNSD